MLLSCVKRLGGLAVTTLPGASRSFNPALMAGMARAMGTTLTGAQKLLRKN